MFHLAIAQCVVTSVTPRAELSYTRTLAEFYDS